MLDQDLPQGWEFWLWDLETKLVSITRTDGSRSGDASDLLSFESFLND